MKIINKNTFLLVAFHLLVFLVPLTVKDTHYHPISDYRNKNSHNREFFMATQKPCMICRFDLSNITFKAIDLYSFYSFINTEKVIQEIPSSYVTHFVSFFHRAPPV